MYRDILIATDGSDRSDKGVDAGIALAKASGAKVTVIIASEPFPTYDLETQWALISNQQAMDSYEAGCKKLAELILSKAQKAAAAAGVECETLHVENSAPAKAIIDTAKSRSCDLIVLTSRGRHAVERFLLGSQASRVVQNAETSVLVVR